MKKEITENEIKEYIAKRNKEIVTAFGDKQTKLSMKARYMDEDGERLIQIAKESAMAFEKALEETKDLVLLVFGTVPAYLKPFYCRHLKLIVQAMEECGDDREYFEETTNILNAIFDSCVITMPNLRKKDE